MPEVTYKAGECFRAGNATARIYGFCLNKGTQVALLMTKPGNKEWKMEIGRIPKSSREVDEEEGPSFFPQEVKLVFDGIRAVLGYIENPEAVETKSKIKAVKLVL